MPLRPIYFVNYIVGILNSQTISHDFNMKFNLALAALVAGCALVLAAPITERSENDVDDVLRPHGVRGFISRCLVTMH